MRKQILFLCLFITISLSCSKKEGDSIMAGPSIVGKWKDGGIKGSITIDFLGQKATEPLDEVPTDQIVEFKSDGTIVNFSAPGDETQFTKYKTIGNQLVLTGIEGTKSFDFIFNLSVNGNTMKLTMDKDLFNKNVLSISASGSDSELADYKEFASFITDLKFEQTLLKQ
jgi:hypothetical protein